MQGARILKSVTTDWNPKVLIFQDAQILLNFFSLYAICLSVYVEWNSIPQNFWTETETKLVYKGFFFQKECRINLPDETEDCIRRVIFLFLLILFLQALFSFN